MALIGKIRKNFWFVLILLGLALAAFILMDMTSAGNAGGAGGDLNMGKVAGERISYRDFQQTESAYFRGSTQESFSKRKSIWDFYVERALLKKEANSMGMSVSQEELMDLQFGSNLSPIVINNWSNPQTGQIDLAQLQQFKTVIENGEQMNPDFRAYWAEQEKQIIKESLQTKLNNLVSKSVYSPTWMAEESFKQDNTQADFEYVKIPFDNIDGTGIEVSDSDIMNYIKSDQNKYRVDEQTRVIDVATITVVPSAADSAAIYQKLNSLKGEFTNTTNDSLFVVSNNGVYTHIYSDAESIPLSVREEVKTLNPGEVYGPFAENGIYLLLKMLDKKVIPDTVKARHILKSTTTGTSVAEATAFIDSIRGAYNRGISFDTLALRHSDDNSNKSNGGDLGEFTQQSMVPEFTKACFVDGRVGGLYTIKTQVGVHLLEVQDQKFTNNEPKYNLVSIAQPMIPSEDTQNAAYDRLADLITANKDEASLRSAIAAESDIEIKSSVPLKANDFALTDLGASQGSRDLIQWAYEPSTDTGDISPNIYRFTDQVNYYDNKYAIGILKSIIPQGLPTASSIRGSVESLVMNKMKAEKFISGLSITNLQDLAAQHSATVETASGVGMKNSFVSGLGNEKEVVAKAFATDIQAISQPVIGNTGVFVVRPLSVSEPPTPSGLPSIKKGLSDATKTQVSFNIIKNMVKRADIKDERGKFF